MAQRPGQSSFLDLKSSLARWQHRKTDLVFFPKTKLKERKDAQHLSRQDLFSKPSDYFRRVIFEEKDEICVSS